MSMRWFRWSLAVLLLAMFASGAPLSADSDDDDHRGDGRSRNGDPVLHWNEVLLDACRHDHTRPFLLPPLPPEQGGPTRASRAFAIVHIAIYDAVNSIDRKHRRYSYQAEDGFAGASIEAAVAQAAHDTLAAMYPGQAATFADELDDALGDVSNRKRRERGAAIGAAAADAILAQRSLDPSGDDPLHPDGTLPGEHRPDPLKPLQGYLSPLWRDVPPFGIENSTVYTMVPPPPLNSDAYRDAFDEVKALGDKFSTERTDEQTEIGLFWAYDGSPGLGVPPRLYNQIVATIARQQKNSIAENARLFALVNIAQADAGIVSWETKYIYKFWRPIVAVRERDFDTNDDTEGDPGWIPLGAPLSNTLGGGDFTPPFPAYTSGHATFGAATFRTLRNFYGTDRIRFSFVSDELNGVTTDSLGNVRPPAVRHFNRLSDAAWENAQSRIYLGIHWSFDAVEGVNQGNAVADEVFDNVLRRAKK